MVVIEDDESLLGGVCEKICSVRGGPEPLSHFIIDKALARRFRARGRATRTQEPPCDSLQYNFFESCAQRSLRGLFPLFCCVCELNVPELEEKGARQRGASAATIYLEPNTL
jgi:hypothetical protein